MDDDEDLQLAIAASLRENIYIENISIDPVLRENINIEENNDYSAIIADQNQEYKDALEQDFIKQCQEIDEAVKRVEIAQERREILFGEFESLTGKKLSHSPQSSVEQSLTDKQNEEFPDYESSDDVDDDFQFEDEVPIEITPTKFKMTNGKETVVISLPGPTTTKREVLKLIEEKLKIIPVMVSYGFPRKSCPFDELDLQKLNGMWLNCSFAPQTNAP